MDCPFTKGDSVTWSQDAPSNWRFLHTPGPMTVVEATYHDGIPTEYSKMFGETGMGIQAGWIVTVEYDADSTSYYDPPLKFYFGTNRVVKMLHEKWLVRA